MSTRPQFRRGLAAMKEAADRDGVYDERTGQPTNAKRHPLHDPVFLGYFVHGFAAFCPRCLNTNVGGWQGLLFPWDDSLDPVCLACQTICEACWIRDPWADESDHVHEAPVPMLTLYTAGLAERPSPSHDQSALWGEVVRCLG